MGRLGRTRGRFRRLPLAGGWTAGRDFPAPEGKTFQQQWARRQAPTRSKDRVGNPRRRRGAGGAA